MHTLHLTNSCLLVNNKDIEVVSLNKNITVYSLNNKDICSGSLHEAVQLIP